MSKRSDVQSLLLKHTKELIQWAKKATKFVGKEVPLYLKEFLQFKVIEEFTLGIGSFLVSIIIGVAMYVVHSFVQGGASGEWYFAVSIAAIPLIAFLCIGVGFILDGVKALVAPRVVILEHLRELS